MNGVLKLAVETQVVRDALERVAAGRPLTKRQAHVLLGLAMDGLEMRTALALAASKLERQAKRMRPVRSGYAPGYHPGNG